MTGPLRIAGRPRRGLAIIADHASSHVPTGMDLGLPPDALTSHIAVDIGTDALTRSLARALQAPALIAGVSRLVVDCNRAPGPAAVPAESDGVAIPGNRALSAAGLEARYACHAAYHDAVRCFLDSERPALLVSIHSFTPRLASRPAEHRPWHVGLLYNRDGQAAHAAIRALRGEGLCVGDNEPYSGELYGYSTDRHAESRGLPYLFFEVRQDLIGQASGIAAWSRRLARVIATVEHEMINGKQKAS